MEELLEQTEEMSEVLTEQPEVHPETQPEPVNAALEQELEVLRKEKLHRLLMDEATLLLNERGIDPGFAAFVLAEDSAATRKKVEQFDRALAATLRKHLAARLPVGEPRDFTVGAARPRRRGIRKVG